MSIDEPLCRVQVWTTDGDEMISDPVKEISTTDQFLALSGIPNPDGTGSYWRRLIPIHVIKGIEITHSTTQKNAAELVKE